MTPDTMLDPARHADTGSAGQPWGRRATRARPTADDGSAGAQGRRPGRVARRAICTGWVVAAMLLSGCMSLVPDYQRPAAPVAPAYPNIEAGPAPDTGVPAIQGAATAAAEVGWRGFYKDPRLLRLIELALQNNRDLRVAALNIEQARLQWQLRRADALPTVNAGATGLRQPTSAGGISSSYAAGAIVTAYELDFFGRVGATSRAAQAQWLGTDEARNTVQISLISGVASGYLSLLADDELLRVTRDALASREESLKLTRLRFDNGAASELDFSQASSLLQGARVALAQLSRTRAQDENALVLLLGQSLPADLPPGLTLAEQARLPALPPGLPSDLLLSRPDVRQAEQQLLAANANIGAARAALFPRISLTGSLGLASSDLGQLFGSGALGWSFAPQLLLPIFDSGRTRAGVDSALVGRDIAVAQYERAIQSAFREVADALAGRATLSAQAQAQTAQTQAEATRLSLVDLRYRNGVSSYLDVLDAQRSLFAAQQAQVQVQALQVQNLVTLYKVLGGGWRD